MSVRFAPSPTGPFHVGNFRTAWISHAWANALKMPWVVRFEDIDAARVVRGSRGQQIDEMCELNMTPDEIVIQSGRRERHFELFEKAKNENAIYPCHCSRKEVLATLASAPHLGVGGEEPLYSGHCRNGVAGKPAGPTVAWRFKNNDPSGKHDFIIARTSEDASENSFLPAYHWACAIDDFDGKHFLLVRAYDLASATATQRKIQSWMGAKTFSAVFHTALVITDNRERLEKRTKGVTLPELVAQGISSEVLIEIFKRSFELKPKNFEPGKIFGEDKKEVLLSDLGIKSLALH